MNAPSPELRELAARGAFASPREAASSDWKAFSEAATPELFCQRWLALQCLMLAGANDGVVVLQKPAGDEFAPAAFWPAGRGDRTLLADVVERAIRAGQGVAVARDTGEGAAAARQHVAYPLRLDGQLRGVVAVNVENRGPAQLEQTMRQLQWGSGWLEVLLRRRQGDPDEISRQRLAFVVGLLASTLEQPDFAAASASCVTQLASFLECDRVALGVEDDGEITIAALSHTANFDQRSNLSRAIEAAMQEAVDQHATIVHPSGDTGAASRAGAIGRAQARLAREFGSSAIVTVPLRNGGRSVGALTFERGNGRAFEAPALELVEGAAALLGPTIDRQRETEKPLLTLARQRARRGWRAFTSAGHNGAKIGAGIAVIALLVLIFATGDYRVTAETAIEGSVQRVVTAPFNGFILEASARPGDTLRAGQTIGKLDDRDMKLERSKIAAVREEREKMLREAMAGHDRAQTRIVASQLAQAEAQLGLLDQQLARTQIVAPFDSVLVRGDLSHALGAPVERGQVLFEVAPLDNYRVIVQVDERDITQIQTGQHGELTLAALPSEHVGFRVARITPVNIAREGRNYFRVEAALDQKDAHLRPGMEGVAKITVGERRLVWIWTHELTNWLRLAVWSWLP